MKKLFCLVPLALTMCISNADDTAATDARPSTSSQIQPRPLFVSGKTRAELLSPGPIQQIPNNATPTTFYFDLKGAPQGSLLIFNTPVTASDFANSTLAGKCVAGASSLAGHGWNGSTLYLDTTTTGSQFYACDGSNPTEPLSRTTKFVKGQLSAGITYYWLVIGYDSTYAMKSTSGLEKFTVAP
jgi:hypothetical protein